MSEIESLANSVRRLAGQLGGLETTYQSSVPALRRMSGQASGRARGSEASHQLQQAAAALDAAARALARAAEETATAKARATAYANFLSSGHGRGEGADRSESVGIAAVAGRAVSIAKAGFGTAAVVGNIIATPVQDALHIDPEIAEPIAGLFESAKKIVEADSSSREIRDRADGSTPVAHDPPNDHRPPPPPPAISELYRIEDADRQ